MTPLKVSARASTGRRRDRGRLLPDWTRSLCGSVRFRTGPPRPCSRFEKPSRGWTRGSPVSSLRPARALRIACGRFPSALASGWTPPGRRCSGSLGRPQRAGSLNLSRPSRICRRRSRGWRERWRLQAALRPRPRSCPTRPSAYGPARAGGSSRVCKVGYPSRAELRRPLSLDGATGSPGSETRSTRPQKVGLAWWTGAIPLRLVGSRQGARRSPAESGRARIARLGSSRRRAFVWTLISLQPRPAPRQRRHLRTTATGRSCCLLMAMSRTQSPRTGPLRLSRSQAKPAQAARKTGALTFSPKPGRPTQGTPLRRRKTRPCRLRRPGLQSFRDLISRALGPRRSRAALRDLVSPPSPFSVCPPPWSGSASSASLTRVQAAVRAPTSRGLSQMSSPLRPGLRPWRHRSPRPSGRPLSLRRPPS